MKPWSVTGTWHVPLDDILCGPYGSKRGQWIYMLFERKWLMYIGLTRTGLKQRFASHVTQKTAVGRLIDASHNKVTVKVLQVKGDLVRAESHYIRFYSPRLNIRCVDYERLLYDYDYLQEAS